MDTLTAILGSQAKVKILRLFLFNPETPFFLSEVARRTRCPAASVRKELEHLFIANILKKRAVSKEIATASHGSAKKARGTGYSLNEKFAHIEPLRNLLIISSVSADETLVKRFADAGRLKLFVAAGVFVQDWDARVDLLIAGESLNFHKIESAIRALEAELGKEIAYSAFETQDFEYRYGIHDRLVRDILDGEHVTLLDRLGIEP